MFFKAHQLWRTFAIVRRGGSTLNSRGRQVLQFSESGELPVLRGVLAEASEIDIKRHEQLQHKITHTIVQRGAPLANKGDILILNDTGQKFYIHDVENPAGIQAGIGAYTLYQAEERADIE